MRFFGQLWRLVKLVCVFAWYLGNLVVLRPRTRPERAAWLSHLCQAVLDLANVTCTVEGTVPMSGAVVTNHLSYLDILVHASIRPCVFVSAIETRRLPLLGWMSMMAGTVYVVRGAGGSAQKAAEGMSKGFRDELPVVFFPEGGAFVGDEPVMPFRSGLLAQVLEAGVPISAGFLRYEVSPEDAARGKSARDDVHWGDQQLTAHIWNLLGLRRLRARAIFAEGPIALSEAAKGDRKLAAEEARAAVLRLSQQGSGT